MCLAVPARICELPTPQQPLALADILGVRRRINVDLLDGPPPELGEWVLVHVGFALARISAAEASRQIEFLTRSGETDAARAEAQLDGATGTAARDFTGSDAS